MTEDEQREWLEDIGAVMKALVAQELAPIRERLDALEAGNNVRDAVRQAMADAQDRGGLCEK